MDNRNHADRLVKAEINLQNFSQNFQTIKQFVGSPVKIMAVVKANAYGHGITEIARRVEKLGGDYLGVSCLYEARLIREAGVHTPILLLGYTDSNSAKEAVQLNLALNVMDEEVLKALNEEAGKQNRKATVHVKIDTGMHRLGLSPDEALQFISRIEEYKNTVLEGVFTHFASADEKNLDFTYHQLDIFNQFLKNLNEKNIHPPLIHAANSAALLRAPQAHFNMVRPGKLLFLPIHIENFTPPFATLPVLTLKTIIAQIRTIIPGETVGYGQTFTAQRQTKVATLPVGYADGFRRSPYNWQTVLVRGKEATVIGRVSMDQASIDITDIPDAQTGDEVVLIGRQNEKELSAYEVAERLKTVDYEVICALHERISRVYLE